MSSSRLLNKAQPQLLAIQQSSRKIYMTVTRLPLRAESTDETVDHLRVAHLPESIPATNWLSEQMKETMSSIAIWEHPTYAVNVPAVAMHALTLTRRQLRIQYLITLDSIMNIRKGLKPGECRSG
jgi:hypothetical protein